MRDQTFASDSRKTGSKSKAKADSDSDSESEDAETQQRKRPRPNGAAENAGAKVSGLGLLLMGYRYY